MQETFGRSMLNEYLNEYLNLMYLNVKYDLYNLMYLNVKYEYASMLSMELYECWSQTSRPRFLRSCIKSGRWISHAMVGASSSSSIGHGGSNGWFKVFPCNSHVLGTRSLFLSFCEFFSFLSFSFYFLFFLSVLSCLVLSFMHICV